MNISETEPSKYNFWLVGSSIVRDLQPKFIYKYKKTRVTTLKDKRIFGATEFLKLGKISTNVIAYQVGSNDLEEKSPEEVIREMEYLILSTQKTLPKSQIVINELLPRFYDNLHNRQVYETKRLKFKSMLHKLSNNYSIRLVTHQNISHIHYLDGIHLNTDSGTAQYVTNIKEIVNTILDVKRVNTGIKMNRRQGKFHDTNRYSQRQDFRYRTYNYRNNRDVQDNTNQRRDFNINNRYHDNRNNDRQHYNTDRYDKTEIMTENTIIQTGMTTELMTDNTIIQTGMTTEIMTDNIIIQTGMTTEIMTDNTIIQTGMTTEIMTDNTIIQIDIMRGGLILVHKEKYACLSFSEIEL